MLIEKVIYGRDMSKIHNEAEGWSPDATMVVETEWEVEVEKAYQQQHKNGFWGVGENDNVEIWDLDLE